MAIYDQLKDIAKVLKEADKIEQYRLILEVQQELMDMQDKIHKLEKTNRTLKDKIETHESLTYENEAYWIIKSDGSKEGPFCSACYDNNEKVIRMRPSEGYPGEHLCPVCKQNFTTDANKKRDAESRSDFDWQ